MNKIINSIENIFVYMTVAIISTGPGLVAVMLIKLLSRLF